MADPAHMFTNRSGSECGTPGSPLYALPKYFSIFPLDFSPPWLAGCLSAPFFTSEFWQVGLSDDYLFMGFCFLAPLSLSRVSRAYPVIKFPLGPNHSCLLHTIPENIW